MGGEHSGVSVETRDIFLESAFFSPLAVAGQARSYGLHTDASHRFERGVDPALAREAAERATALLLEITGGEPGPIVEVASAAYLPGERQVRLRAERLEQALGKALPAGEVREILERLGMSVEESAEGWSARAPSWRFDIAIEEDLIEELARIHGYNRLPVRRPAARLSLRPDHEARTPLGRLRRQMVARGYQEAVTYSFVSPELQGALLPEAVSPALANPISSDLSVMRASLFPGLVRALQYNLNRQQSRVRLFETGLVFRGDLDDLHQTPMLGALACGSHEPEGWAGGKASVDFFDLKGDLESLLAMINQAVEPTTQPAETRAGDLPNKKEEYAKLKPPPATRPGVPDSPPLLTPAEPTQVTEPSGPPLLSKAPKRTSSSTPSTRPTPTAAIVKRTSTRCT